MTSRSQAIKEIRNDFGKDLEPLSLHPHLESQPWEERLGAGRASLDGHMGRTWGPVPHCRVREKQPNPQRVLYPPLLGEVRGGGEEVAVRTSSMFTWLWGDLGAMEGFLRAENTLLQRKQTQRVLPGPLAPIPWGLKEIGRASCRERV